VRRDQRLNVTHLTDAFVHILCLKYCEYLLLVLHIKIFMVESKLCNLVGRIQKYL